MRSEEQWNWVSAALLVLVVALLVAVGPCAALDASHF